MFSDAEVQDRGVMRGPVLISNPSQDYSAAREAFQECVQMCPDLVQAWVSWAQFEKRAQQGCLGDHLQRCRSVLQRGLTLNPNNAKLCQVCMRLYSERCGTGLASWQGNAMLC